MFRVAIVTYTQGVLLAKDFLTKSEADEYCLEVANREGIKVAYIDNTETGEREKLEDLRG